MLFIIHIGIQSDLAKDKQKCFISAYKKTVNTFQSEGWGVSFSQYLAAKATPLTVCNVILDGTCNICNFYRPYIKVTRQNE